VDASFKEKGGRPSQRKTHPDSATLMTGGQLGGRKKIKEALIRGLHSEKLKNPKKK